MFVYIVTIILCVFFSFLSVKSKEKNRVILALIPMFILFLVSALRYNVGIDYSGTYTDVYNWIASGAQNVRMDIAFLCLYKFLVFFGFELQWFFVITSFFINYYIYLSIEKLSLNKFLSYFIYICSTFYFFTMNGIRQSFAMAIFYFSLKYVKEKKMWTFLIINLIGSLFHQSALIFLPIYFLVNCPFKKKLTYLILILILFVSIPTILPILVSILSNTKYVLYFLHNNYNPLASFNFSSIFNLFLFLLYLYKLDFKKKEDTLGFAFMICHFVGVCLSLFLTTVPLALRIFESFRFIDYLSVPYYIKKYVKTNKSMCYGFVVMFYIFYFVHHIWLNNANGVLPYMTIFER